MKDRFQFDPRNDLQNYREAIRQLLEGGWVLPRDLMPSAMNAIVFPVDVIDNGPEIVIQASLPGVRPQDLSVAVLGDTLTIKASLPDEDLFPGGTYLRRERRASAFTRSLRLPLPVVAERAEARLKNGILTLVLPKRETTRPKSIRVTSG